MRHKSLRHDLPTETPQQSTDPAKIYEEHSLDELRNAGYRITMPRVQVIRALADTRRALSAYAIHEKILRTGGKIDVVSVYRILATLQEVGLIHHIGVVDGYFPCRMTDCDSKKSEVVVFEDSSEVMELQIPEELLQLIERQSEEFGFLANTVKVEITGMRKAGATRRH